MRADTKPPLSSLLKEQKSEDAALQNQANFICKRERERRKKVASLMPGVDGGDCKRPETGNQLATLKE